MDYLKEMHAFYDQQDTNPLSSSANAVWGALMHLSHKAGWPKELSVAVSVVMLRAGVKERTFYNARNELKEKGYIDFLHRSGNQAAIYSLYSLADNAAGSHADKRADSHAVRMADSRIDAHSAADTAADSVAGSVSPFIKEDKTSDKTEKKNNPYCFYEDNGFGILSPYIADEINTWLSEPTFKEPELIVVEAMKVALARDARNWRYVSKVLQTWQGKRLTTLQEISLEGRNRQKKGTPPTPKKKEGTADENSTFSAATSYPGYQFRF